MDHVSFSLPRGCILGLIGENGAGKSTMIRLMLGLSRCDSGKSRLLGCESSSLTSTVKEKIGVVFDESFFSENLKVDEIEKVLKGIYRHWDTEAFRGYIKRFGLPSQKAVKTFSKGMKMKLSIAAALSHHAELLILDEATSGLDPVVREEILDLLLDFIQDERCSVLLSSHITNDLEKICDYILFLSGGRMLAFEEKDVLLEKYAILRCGNDEIDLLPQNEISGIRKNRFGAEVLIRRKAVPDGFTAEPVNLEQMMLLSRNSKGGEEYAGINPEGLL